MWVAFALQNSIQICTQELITYYMLHPNILHPKKTQWYHKNDVPDNIRINFLSSIRDCVYHTEQEISGTGFF